MNSVNPLCLTSIIEVAKAFFLVVGAKIMSLSMVIRSA